MNNLVERKGIKYSFRDKQFEGQLFSKHSEKKLPGVLIVHTWLGIDQSIEKRAKRVAELGYAAFVVDLFGPGILPKPPVESMNAITPYIKDRQLFRDALETGLRAFKTFEAVDPSKIAAIGYCFGGCGVLEMARAGMELVGVVSLHGELNTNMPAKPGTTRARISVLHGDADVVVKQNTVSDFFNEMRESGADWEFTSYSKAKHSFTGEGTAAKDTPEAGLNEIAESRSWESMTSFLEDVFKQ